MLVTSASGPLAARVAAERSSSSTWYVVPAGWESGATDERRTDSMVKLWEGAGIGGSTEETKVRELKGAIRTVWNVRRLRRTYCRFGQNCPF